MSNVTQKGRFQALKNTSVAISFPPLWIGVRQGNILTEEGRTCFDFPIQVDIPIRQGYFSGIHETMSAYLLLRDNKKTGPHTHEAMLSMGLMPLDLIWVEGRSQRWNHPSELEDFRSFPLSESGSRQRVIRTHIALPGIMFRLPVQDDSAVPWGPVPTLALQGVDLFMHPLTRQRAVVLPTMEADADPSLFAMPAPAEWASRGAFASGHVHEAVGDHRRTSSSSLRDRRISSQGKAVRRSRKKNPHHLDLSDLLADPKRSACMPPSVALAEGGFHIEFS